MPGKVLPAVTGHAMHSVVFPVVSHCLFSSFLHFFFVCYSNVSEEEGKNDPLFKYVKGTGFFSFCFSPPAAESLGEGGIHCNSLTSC